MGYRRIVLGIGLLSFFVTFSGSAQSGSDFSVASLSTKQGPVFLQKEVVFIQQYYSYAPKFFVDDVLKNEKALPAAVASSIARGKALPKELIPFLQEPPASVVRNLGTLPRGLNRKVLGSRFLLLDSRLIVRDMIRLPTVVAGDQRK